MIISRSLAYRWIKPITANPEFWQFSERCLSKQNLAHPKTRQVYRNVGLMGKIFPPYPMFAKFWMWESMGVTSQPFRSSVISKSQADHDKSDMTFKI